MFCDLWTWHPELESSPDTVGGQERHAQVTCIQCTAGGLVVLRTCPCSWIIVFIAMPRTKQTARRSTGGLPAAAMNAAEVSGKAFSLPRASILVDE